MDSTGWQRAALRPRGCAWTVSSRAWIPTARRSTTCARILAVDGQLAWLINQRQALVEQYERHRFAIAARPGTPVPVAGSRVPARRSGVVGVGTRRCCCGWARRCWASRR